MKKEKTNKKLVVISIIIVVICFFLVILLAPKYYAEFNLDKHICEKACIEYDCEDAPKRRCQVDNQWSYCGYSPYKCADWRDKTKCELNPNAEGCICDEWKYVSRVECTEYMLDKYGITYREYSETHGGGETITGSDYYNGGENTYNLVRGIDDRIVFNVTEKCPKYCIKSHEPNECEKGNPNYIIDSKCNGEPLKKENISICNPCMGAGNEKDLCYSTCKKSIEKHNNNVDGHKKAIEKCKKKNCRLKTIMDYSCKDLKEAVLLNAVYCVNDNNFYYDIKGCPLFTQNPKSYSTYNIYFIAIKKGCEI